ncbi:MAG: Panacea domain-containing protein [Bryobacteraceae bacterium]
MARPQENIQKFKELILYISQNSADDPAFGSVKLNKLLFFSDFVSFAYNGAAITGAEYMKLELGPGPRHLVPVREEMIRDGELGIQEKAKVMSGTVQQKPVNLREPNLDLFSAKEIALVDSVIRSLATRSANDTSRLSHMMCAWKLAPMGSTIPYGAVFLSDSPLTEPDKVRGQELAKEYNLLEQSTAA